MIVKLSTGIEVEVQPVPPLALTNVAALLPLRGLDETTYNAVQAARKRSVQDTAWLLAFPGLRAPDSWQFPLALQHVGLQPREGDTGRLLDYIEYGLLLNNDDIQRVQAVMHDGALTEAEVEAAVETFRRQRRWETAALDSEFGESA